MMTTTPWGYDVETDEGRLPPLISVDDFQALTGSTFDDEARVEAAIDAVSMAVRNACHWHVAPALECHHVTQGPGRVITLPAMAVQDVTEVTECGEPVEGVEWLPDGFVRKPCGRRWCPSWRSVEVAYTAGYDLATLPDLGQVVAQIVSNAIAASPGVLNERAGDVEIHYNQAASGVAGGATLLRRDLAMLAPYRLPALLG